MGLFDTLISTYDANIEATTDFDHIVMLPIAHMSVNAYIELAIDRKGNFVTAKVIEKEDIKTIIPTDYVSSGRSSGLAAHPYEDTLSYIAGDYTDHILDEKAKKASKKKYDLYIKAITDWHNSNYSNTKVDAVYHYVSKNTVINDLIHVGVLIAEDGPKKILSDGKINAVPYEKCMVRFRVIGTKPEESWLDPELMKCFTKYYLDLLQNDESMKQISMVSSAKEAIIYNHPKGILDLVHDAKLLTSNDSKGYTYRGRFTNDQEAYAVDYVSSQKAHNALTWLVKTQGKLIGNREFLIWSTSNKKMDRIWDNLYDKDNYPITIPEYQEDIQSIIDKRLKTFSQNDKITYLALEAATTGRLSVTNYGELLPSEYYQRLQDWYTSCCWMNIVRNTQEKSFQRVVMTPSIKNIVECAYGSEGSKGFLDVAPEVQTVQYQRLMHCVLDHTRIPKDLIDQIVRQASNPQKYTEKDGRRWNWNKVLCVACALLHKYYSDTGRIINMEVDRDETDRSYLYGRLLAIYECIEDWANHMSGITTRSSNVARFQSTYAQQPFTVRPTLESMIAPYLNQLSSDKKKFVKQEMEQISNVLKSNTNNRALSGLYLIGYWSEREQLRYSNRMQKDTIQKEKS